MAEYVRVTWKTVSIALLVVSAAAVATLSIVAAVGDASVLSTVALALAVVAFITQLLVFVSQIGISIRQTERSERLYGETSVLLNDVKAHVEHIASTQSTQFEQVLQYALGVEVTDIREDLRAWFEQEVVPALAPSAVRATEEELLAIGDRLARLPQVAERQIVESHVRCPRPQCGEDNVVDIGNVPGDSAMASCKRCGHRFHVHRGSGGGVFGRLPGSRAGDTGSQDGGTPDLESILRAKRMELPPAAERQELLHEILRRLRDGKLERAADITEWMTDSPGAMKTPLFFALINETYGPIVLDNEPPWDDEPLSRRPIRHEEIQQPDEWLDQSHAAWLAQAAYRLLAVTDDEGDLRQCFFPRDPDGDLARRLTARAIELAKRDRVERGRDG
jgi:hypothetical protein